MQIIFKLDKIDEAAMQFLKSIGNKNTIAFNGQMGAGKTTFIHALCNALQVQENVSSPTFSIINQYATNDGKKIYHIDLYRLKDETEVINAGVEDCLNSGNICFVEWPEKALGIFPNDTLYINITTVDTNTRKVSFNL